MKIKTCTNCGEEKDITEFYYRKDSEKYRNACKECHKQIHEKSEKQLNKEKLFKLGKKVCTNCGIEKDLDKFSKTKTGVGGLRSDCKDCRNINNKEWYDENREERLRKCKIWNRDNKEKISKQKKEYFQENKTKLNKTRRIQKRKRYNEDITYKLKVNLRSRVYSALQGNFKSKRMLELLGCSIEELKQHLESQFTEGMTWENHSVHGWHIDHIKPCFKFDLTDLKQQEECFHYSNLQPLWAEDNWSKNKK